MTTISRTLAVADIPNLVKRKMGDSSLTVELADDDFYGKGGTDSDLKRDGIIAEALLWYSRYWPKYGYTVVPVSGGVQQYELDNSVGDQQWGFGAVNVLVPPTRTQLGLGLGVSPDELISFDIRYMTEIGDLHLDLSYLETAKRIVSAEFDWRFDPDFPSPGIGTLWIYPVPESTNIPQVVLKYQDLHHIEQIPLADQHWFLLYAAALGKELIGEKRAKFGGQIPGQNEGQNLNGSDLVSTAQEEKEKITEDFINDKGDFMPPLVGSGI